ncbi:hypothetical protein ACU8DI_02465 [Psychroserpens sp. BH13MA-6]
MLRIKKYDKLLLFFFAAVVIGSFLTWAFEERFDPELWRSNPTLRYKMADDIIENRLLIGKTKEEIKRLLGFPSKSAFEGKDNVVYRMGRAPSFFEPQTQLLVIVFENNHVKEVFQTEE